VVEAACLAHDLGHPPFGHLGEEVLDELMRSDRGSDPEGFEGNAQTFRVLTKLALRFDECHGLDLTRATLSSCLKYPWIRDTADPKKKRKCGAYQSEREDLEFARLGCDSEFKTAEAELMDWADDIAYSVHDLEDFTSPDHS
jgi:dGTPase